MSGKLFSLISVVLLLGLVLTSVARADYVYTPMEQHLDANSYNIFDVNDLDVDGDLDVTGMITTADIITKGPWVDVRAYGANGDDEEDDTAASLYKQGPPHHGR